MGKWSRTGLQWGHRLLTIALGQFRTFGGFGAEIEVLEAVGARVRAARPAKHRQGSFGGSWVCFRRFLDVFDHFQYNFHVFHWFCMDIGTSGVLYAAIVIVL